MKERNNSNNKKFVNYDWKEIQRVYDSGLSYRDIIKLYDLSSQTLINQAVKNGLFTPRKISDSVSISKKNGKGKLTVDGKKRLADSARTNINKRYENGWSPKAGRCKKYKYISPIAGEVSLDGKWELAVAKWLDQNNFLWKRNTIRFQYINLKNKISYYTPDFWVEELGGYLEIKGYETELDRCKWSQFNECLVVWKKKELKHQGVIP
jgi:hypothetical protein